MRLMKHSLVGLALAGILALAPTTGFARGGGGGGHGGGGHFGGGGGHFGGGGAHFVARVGSGSNPRFHYGNGGVVIFDPLDYSTDGDFDDDYTGYQPLDVAPNTAILPYATPTSDPDIVISPYVRFQIKCD